jgi:hypothetical protein
MCGGTSKLRITAPWTDSYRQESNPTKSPREKSTTTLRAILNTMLPSIPGLQGYHCRFQADMPPPRLLLLGVWFLIQSSLPRYLLGSIHSSCHHSPFLDHHERNDALWSRQLGRRVAQVIRLVWQWLRVHESAVHINCCMPLLHPKSTYIT